MMEADGSVYFHQTGKGKAIEIISRSHTCDLFAPLLDDIEFTIGDQIISLTPAGYVHPEYIGKKNPNECLAGFKASKDGQYRLGRNFLRNFKMGLDFENNQILLEAKPGYSSIRKVGEEKV